MARDWTFRLANATSVIFGEIMIAYDKKRSKNNHSKYRWIRHRIYNNITKTTINPHLLSRFDKTLTREIIKLRKIFFIGISHHYRGLPKQITLSSWVIGMLGQSREAIRFGINKLTKLTIGTPRLQKTTITYAWPASDSIVKRRNDSE